MLFIYAHFAHLYEYRVERKRNYRRNINFLNIFFFFFCPDVPNIVNRCFWLARFFDCSKPARYYIVSIDKIFICQRRCIRTVYLIIRYFGHFFRRTTNLSILRNRIVWLSLAPCLFWNIISHSFLRNFIWFRQVYLEYVYNTKILNKFLKIVICADKKQSDEQFLSKKYQKVLLYARVVNNYLFGMLSRRLRHLSTSWPIISPSRNIKPITHLKPPGVFNEISIHLSVWCTKRRSLINLYQRSPVRSNNFSCNFLYLCYI